MAHCLSIPKGRIARTERRRTGKLVKRKLKPPQFPGLFRLVESNGNQVSCRGESGEG